MGFTYKLTKVIVLCIAVIGLFYIGACTYGNVVVFNDNPYNAPDASKATYAVRIVNTGNLLYSDDVKRDGNVITLDGFWTLNGDKWQLKKSVAVLDESIFGPVLVRVRTP